MDREEIRVKVGRAMIHLQDARAALNSYGGSYGGMSEKEQLRRSLREGEDADREVEKAIKILNDVQVAHHDPMKE